MAVRIITDSASDIDDIDDPRLRVVPLSISFGDQTFKDGVDLDHARFYELLVEREELPTTGQVTPFEWQQAFEAALEGPEDELVCVTISSKLSGTNQSAVVAAEGFGGRVHVVDSLNACLGQRILVELALRLAAEGRDADQIASELMRKRGDVRLVALLDTLEYLRRGGRIDAVSAGIGTMLQVKPVVAIRDGAVVTLGKARGSKNGRNLLSEEVERSGGIDIGLPLAIGYSGPSDHLLRKYVEDSRWLWEGRLDEIPVHTVGSAVGTHVGPGGIALAYFSQA
ncbi:DegV family protein [Olsenella phocaeensis]|uniref:DegV family protein n=1 Tax=Olsenella phocaeensis TaxID=1852385 RepID=UPI003A93B33A